MKTKRNKLKTTNKRNKHK